MKQIGTVIQVESNQAIVAMSCEATCVETGSCGCGAHERLHVNADDPLGVEPGQQVELTLSSTRAIGAVLLVFWVPIVIGIFSYYLGFHLWEWFGGDSGYYSGLMLCGIGLLFSLWFIYIIEKRMSKSKSGFKILRVVDGKVRSAM